MVSPRPLFCIVPVKDSPDTTLDTLRALVDAGCQPVVYDDFSTPENAALLDQWAQEMHFSVYHHAAHTQHPSPNYRETLILAREEALRQGAHLVIVESDVTVRPHTLHTLQEAVEDGVGLVAAVTVDSHDVINYPYNEGKRHFSFCCTLLSYELLQALDFRKELSPEKNWFDVTISHRSKELGFRNILQNDNRVLHRPHSSRPWKLLKYTNPLRYYLQKLLHGRDKI